MSAVLSPPLHDEAQARIEALEARVAELERLVDTLFDEVGDLRVEAGMRR